MGVESAEMVDGPRDGGEERPADADLVRRAADGELRALERLYRRHVDRVYALCLRMTADERAAEELTQDVWVRVWRKAGSWRGEAAFTTWLHRVTANLVRDRGRRRARREEREAPRAAAGPSDESRPPPPVEDRLALEAAIRELPDRARQVFVLHDVQGYPHAEVAGMLGIAEGTSKSHLHRARKLLRSELEA